MKNVKNLIVLALAVILVLTCIPMQAQAAVMLNSTSKTMSIGETATLKVYGASTKVKWSSSNKSVASVNQKGKVTAKGAGTATIKAKISKNTLKCKITVNKPVKEYESKVLYEDDEIIITFTGISGKENNYKVDFLIENISDRDLEVQVRDTSINGFMVDPICSMEVASGKKTKDSMEIWGGDAETTPLSEISNIETKFWIFSWDDITEGNETEVISILD